MIQDAQLATPGLEGSGEAYQKREKPKKETDGSRCQTTTTSGLEVLRSAELEVNSSEELWWTSVAG